MGSVTSWKSSHVIITWRFLTSQVHFERASERASVKKKKNHHAKGVISAHLATTSSLYHGRGLKAWRVIGSERVAHARRARDFTHSLRVRCAGLSNADFIPFTHNIISTRGSSDTLLERAPRRKALLLEGTQRSTHGWCSTVQSTLADDGRAVKVSGTPTDALTPHH